LDRPPYFKRADIIVVDDLIVTRAPLPGRPWLTLAIEL
jgi:hypothetical protein